MNPYAKGLSNAVLGQSAPTSAGKVSTHFNSPYMKAISQNLMTAIYGSPQDELTRQQIASSKLGMQQIQSEMDTSAAQGLASAKLGAMLSDKGSYDTDDNLTPTARRELSALNIASGGTLGDFFTYTGDHQRTIAGQDNKALIDATAAETEHGYDINMANLNSDLNKALANLNHSNTLGRDAKQNSYTTERDGRLHIQGLEDIMAVASNTLYNNGIQNAFTADQNEQDRQLESTQSAVDAVLENETNASQVGSLAEIFGVPMGTDLTESLSGIEPNVTGIKPTEFINLLDTSSELLWKNLGLDYNNPQHKKAFGPISQKLAALLQDNPNNATEIIAGLQSQAYFDGKDLMFEGGNLDSWGMEEKK